jgi:hypothetical protein
MLNDSTSAPQRSSRAERFRTRAVPAGQRNPGFPRHGHPAAGGPPTFSTQNELELEGRVVLSVQNSRHGPTWPI